MGIVEEARKLLEVDTSGMGLEDLVDLYARMRRAAEDLLEARRRLLAEIKTLISKLAPLGLNVDEAYKSVEQSVGPEPTITQLEEQSYTVPTEESKEIGHTVETTPVELPQSLGLWEGTRVYASTQYSREGIPRGLGIATGPPRATPSIGRRKRAREKLGVGF